MRRMAETMDTSSPTINRNLKLFLMAILSCLTLLPNLSTCAPTVNKEQYLTRNKRSHGHHTPHFHAPGMNMGVNYPQVMHFSADNHEGHSVDLNYHRHNMLNHMQKEHHLHRDHIKHVVDHHLNDHLHHNHFNLKTKHYLPFHTVLHRFHYKHHDTHHKAALNNKLFYAPKMYNAYAFVKDHHHHHDVAHNKHHHHYPTEHHHDSSHGHLKLQPGQAMAGAGGSQPDYTMMNAGDEQPQMQLPMMQHPGMDPQGGMAQPGITGQNVMMQPMGMDPNAMMQPSGMDANAMMQQGGMVPNAMMPNTGMMGMMPQQPGMMQQQPGMMAQQPGMMSQQLGMMQQQPGMMPQPGMMQPMTQGMQPAMNQMQPGAFMQGNGYMMPNGYQQPAMMGAATAPMIDQSVAMAMGEQPVAAAQTAAETDGAASDAAVASVGTDKY